MSTVSTDTLVGVITLAQRPALAGLVFRYRSERTALGTIPAEELSATTSLSELVPLYVDLLFGLILPVLLVLWLGHAALGVRTWPPWEVLRR